MTNVHLTVLMSFIREETDEEAANVSQVGNVICRVTSENLFSVG